MAILPDDKSLGVAESRAPAPPFPAWDADIVAQDEELRDAALDPEAIAERAARVAKLAELQEALHGATGVDEVAAITRRFDDCVSSVPGGCFLIR